MVLKEYHAALAAGKKMTLEQMLGLYEKLWSPEGFLSREHEEKRFESGRKMLVDYFTTHTKPSALNLAEKPLGVEEDFSFTIDGKIIVRGRWDRLDEIVDNMTTKGGSGRGAGRIRLIVDFKTSGGIVDEEDALKETKKSRQLVIYALGHKGKYGRLPDYVALYFLEPGIMSMITIGEDRIGKLIKEIKEVAEGIRAGHFPAKPGYYSCDYCPYRTICIKSK
jgi:DNA helicase-2/ATP-dependent DNA helicase PcrA